MLDQYLGVVLTFGFAAIVVAVMCSASMILGAHRPNAVKQTVFECGNPPTGPARGRFSVKFYLVAMLFIIFDIEVVFMVPWAVAFFQAREKVIPLSMGLVLADMVVFMLILAVGYVYAWKRGALQWD